MALDFPPSIFPQSSVPHPISRPATYLVVVLNTKTQSNLFTCGEAYRSRRAFYSWSVVRFSQNLQILKKHIFTWLPREQLTSSGKVDSLVKSWLPGNLWHLDLKVSRISGFHGFLEFTDFWISWIFGFLIETFPKINRWNIGAAGSKRTFPSCFCLFSSSCTV